jgi:hypothetical protein
MMKAGDGMGDLPQGYMRFLDNEILYIMRLKQCLRSVGVPCGYRDDHLIVSSSLFFAYN